MTSWLSAWLTQNLARQFQSHPPTLKQPGTKVLSCQHVWTRFAVKKHHVHHCFCITGKGYPPTVRFKGWQFMNTLSESTKDLRSWSVLHMKKTLIGLHSVVPNLVKLWVWVAFLPQVSIFISLPMFTIIKWVWVSNLHGQIAWASDVYNQRSRNQSADKSYKNCLWMYSRHKVNGRFCTHTYNQHNLLKRNWATVPPTWVCRVIHFISTTWDEGQGLTCNLPSFSAAPPSAILSTNSDEWYSAPPLMLKPNTPSSRRISMWWISLSSPSR